MLTAFQRALHARDADALRALLARHPDARARIDDPMFPFDTPALVHFANAGDLAMVEALLEHGADPNRRTDWWAGGFHALHGATGEVAARLLAAGAVADACAAANLDRPDVLLGLLEAEPSRVHERGGDGQTPLHFARSRAVVDLLLARGADPDARDVDHRSTPAEWMLAQRRGAGRYDLAAYLVERGASADIFLAAALGLVDRLRALLAADPLLIHARTGQGSYGEQPPSSFHIYTWTIGANRSPLQVAAQFDQPEALELLRSLAPLPDRFLAACDAAEGETARRMLRDHPGLLSGLGPGELRRLPDAAWAGDAAAVALMLDLGFDVGVTGESGGTALHCAAWKGSRACVEAVLRLPAGRALVGRRDAVHGTTPLHWCGHGARHCAEPGGDYAAVTRLLLAAGATPDGLPDETPADVRAIVEAWRAPG